MIVLMNEFNVMTQTADTLQRFMFEHANIRGEIAHLNETYQAIIQQHPYPPMVKQLLGQALVSVILLTGSIKFEGNISLQFQGDERLPLLLVQCNHLLDVRGYAKYCKEDETVDYHAAFLTGKMMLTIAQDNQTQPYRSVVPIVSGHMSDNLMHYFAQSEQISSRVWLAANDEQASGMLLQLMPSQDTQPDGQTQQREEFWEYAVQIGQTITEHELLTLDNETLLHRLYHETQLRLYPARALRFQCRCNEERVKQALLVLGEKEVQALSQEKKVIDIRCDFCNKNFTFDAIDVAMLFRK